MKRMQCIALAALVLFLGIVGAASAAPWTGSAGTVTNQGTPIGSSPTVVSDGTAGPAVFTYETVNSFCCHTGNWTFKTVAATTNDVRLNWTYAGYHGTCDAHAKLTVFVHRAGVDVFPPITLYNATDSCNGSPPSGGFGQYGEVILPGVLAGDEYGFTMEASNFDSNGGVSGILTLTTGTSPTTTAVVSSANPIVLPSPITFTATITGSSPTGTVTFTQESREIQGCIAIPLVGNTAACFVGPPINPGGWFSGPPRTILALYSGDTVNAGSVSPPLLQTVNVAVTPPGAPTIGSATVPTGSQTATVTWSAPASDGGSPITGYTIHSVPGGLTGSAAAGATSATVSGLSFGQSYTFNVTATNAAGVSPQSSASNSVTAMAFAPSLIRAIEASSAGTATLYGRVDGAPPGAVVQPLIAPSCNSGVVGGVPIAVGSAVAAAQNPDGYIIAMAPGVASGQFVALQLIQSGTPISGLSACLPSLGGNDFWTTAQLVGADTPAAGSASANDYIDAPGKTRWYKFKVAPGQQISVSLGGTSPNALPADYDLAVFKDIGAAFAAQLAPADSAALTKLSAEFAPSTFSPSTFSPSTFSPSTFSPSTFSADAFTPSTFSPSTFSPSTFSPSTFSPSTFSPSTFSPSTFSPSTFSPSTFSPSTFSPSTFSPSTFSPDVINTAFSSAQTRSLIGVSAATGTANESVVVDSWNNGGYFYARVTGRAGAFSTAGQFSISATKSASRCDTVTDTTLAPRAAAAANGTATVILTDTSSFASYPAGDVASMTGNLSSLASSTGGVVVNVATDSRVQALKAQALVNSACPYATNLVAEEIKGIVDSYRQNNPVRFVVIAGGDDVIPFFRYPDQTLLGQESDYVPPVTGTSDASLRGNFVLSQDTYGSRTRISLRTSDYPVPGLAVGRLVKTPTEIAGMIDAAMPNLTTVNGAIVPGTSLVTGYDFLADVSAAVATELQAGMGATPDQLIAPNNISPQDPASWHASDLAAKLFGSRHDVVFLAGHFSANSALAADFATNLITSDLASSRTDFTNSIVFSAGCHSGYTIVNRDALSGVTFTLDWAQAFAQKKATLVAGTGYQYGDTDFIEYSERLYLNFARELRAGFGAVAIGEALVKAKIDYLAATPDIRGIHTKALLESTLYGLPMLGVNMPSGRGAPAGGAFSPAITPAPVTDPTLPATSLGLRISDLQLAQSTTTRHLQLTGAKTTIPGPLATWLEGSNGVVSNPSEPALPLNVVNVTPTDGSIVLRGVGFRGGSYSDSLIVPLTGAPATEIRGVHVPFASPYFFPNRPWTINYFGTLAGNGATSLLVTPAQHRGADVDPVTGFLRSTLRQYSTLNLRLYYSSNRTQASLSDAPTIVKVDAQPGTSGSVQFTAQVTGDPTVAIHQVWVTYTDGSGAWVPVDLMQCGGTPNPPICGTTTDSQIWKGTATPSSPGIYYVVQAAGGTGLVSFDDNRGAYYSLNTNFGGSTTTQAAAAAATELSFDAAPTSATYGDTVGVTVRLMSGSQPVAGGLVNVNIGGFGNSGLTDASGRVTLSATVSSAPGSGIPISASYAGSGTQLLATSAATSFTVSKATASLTPVDSGVGVKVTAPVVVGNTPTPQPVTGQSVSFAFANTGFVKTIVVNTDSKGNATAPTAQLPVGTYSVTASFLPAALAGQDTYYTGATVTLDSFTMNAQSIAFTAPTPTTSVSAPLGTFSVAAGVTGPNGGQPVAITSSTPDVCTVTGQPAPTQATFTATIVRGGANCLLSADVGGSNTYAPAHADATIAIVKAAQTITSFTGPTTPLTYAPPGTFTGAATAASPNSGQVVTITSARPEVCTVADTPVTNGATYTATIVAAGAECVLSADLSENNFYTAAQARLTIPIVKAAQTITFNLPVLTKCPTHCTYGDPGFNVSATGGASGKQVTFSSSTTSVCTVNTDNSVAIGGAGTCTLAADQEGTATYSPSSTVTQSFTVARAGQIIDNFAVIQPKTYRTDGPFVVNPNAASSAGFQVTLSASGNCTLDKTTQPITPPVTVTLTGAGSCTIMASAPGNANYAPVSPAQTFNIAGSPQTIAFTNPGNKALGTAAFPLVASANPSGLPVTFAVVDTEVCTLLPNGTTLKLLEPGVCTVTAKQPGGSSDYAAAADVQQSFKVYLSGVTGLTSVAISSGNSLTDSFDSTPGLGGYAATKGALVNVLSNGTINVQGNVWGNVESATANVVVGGGRLVTGNVTAATTVSNAGSIGGTSAANQPLPSIVAPAIAACTPFTPATPAGWITGSYTYNATKGDLTISGGNTATLTSGTYCLNSVTVSGGSTLAVNGPVKINLTGSFTVSGNSVVNPTLIPRNLQVATSYAGNNGVTMSGGVGYFTVYAPGTSVTLSGSAELFGAVVGKSYTGSGGHKMHYDVQTLDVWGSIFGF